MAPKHAREEVFGLACFTAVADSATGAKERQKRQKEMLYCSNSRSNVQCRATWLSQLAVFIFLSQAVPEKTVDDGYRTRQRTQQPARCRQLLLPTKLK